MPSAQAMVSKVNLEKPPQYAIEGSTPNDYAGTLNNPVFVAPMNLSEFEPGLDNQFLDSKFGGKLDNQGKIKIRETNSVKIRGRVLPTNECMELLEWCSNIDPGKKATGRIGGNSNNMTMTAVKGGTAGNAIRFIIQYSGTGGAISISGNTITYSATSQGRTLSQIKTDVTNHAGASALVTIGAITGDNTSKPQAATISLSGGTRGGKDGPKESRTWIVSYLNNADQEVYRIARGCKPLAANISFTKEDTVMLEITCSCKDYYETTAPTTGTGMTGTPVYSIAEPTDDGLTYEHLGDFHYDPVLNSGDKTKNNTDALIFRTGNINIAWGKRAQDSNGSLKDFFHDYGSRDVTGSFDLFKTGHELNEDARKATQYVGWIDIQYTGTGEKDSQSETIAKATAVGSDGVNIYSKLPGKAGNDITLEILAASTRATQTEVRTNGHEIQVAPKKGGDTVTNIVNKINDNKLSNNLVTAEVKGSGSTNISAAVARVTCTGGVSRWRRLILERMKWDTSNETLLKDETNATMESKSLMADTLTASTTT